MRAPTSLSALLALSACASARGSTTDPSPGTADPLPAWAEELLAAIALPEQAWLTELGAERSADAHLLTWRRVEQFGHCILEAPVWVRLEGMDGTRWALAHTMRWPPDGGAWPEDEVRSWGGVSYVHAQSEPIRLYDSPPDNDDVEEVWPSAMFGTDEGWPIVAGDVRRSAWARAIGEPPRATAYRTRTPTTECGPLDRS